MKTRKSWREKLEKEQEFRIVEIPPKMRRRFGTGRNCECQPKMSPPMLTENEPIQDVIFVCKPVERNHPSLRYLTLFASAYRR